jgi:hypothetical protein
VLNFTGSPIHPLGALKDALRDPDWVMAMQEELNNFTRNEVSPKVFRKLRVWK